MFYSIKFPTPLAIYNSHATSKAPLPHLLSAPTLIPSLPHSPTPSLRPPSSTHPPRPFVGSPNEPIILTAPTNRIPIVQVQHSTPRTRNIPPMIVSTLSIQLATTKLILLHVLNCVALLLPLHMMLLYPSSHHFLSLSTSTVSYPSTSSNLPSMLPTPS